MKVLWIRTGQRPLEGGWRGCRYRMFLDDWVEGRCCGTSCTSRLRPLEGGCRDGRFRGLLGGWIAGWVDVWLFGGGVLGCMCICLASLGNYSDTCTPVLMSRHSKFNVGEITCMLEFTKPLNQPTYL